MATIGQINLITRLCEERGVDLDAFNGYEVDTEMTNRQVSEVLDYLKSLPRPVRQQAAPVELVDGIYLLDVKIYKVVHAVHGSGRQYAKVLTVYGPGDASFERAPGAIRNIRPEHRMTKEQAKEYGALYGVCVRCGATLTAEDSIDRMMGPVCASKI